MSINRRAAKRDANEPEIIKALRAAGATVEQLSEKGVPDLLVGFMGSTYLMEVKTPKGKLTPDQTTWIDLWQGQVHIVRTVEEALRIIGR